jgi:hypothetical protein
MLFILSVISIVHAEPVELGRNYCKIYGCNTGMVWDNHTCIYPSLLYSSYYLNPCPDSLPYCAPNVNTLVNVTCEKSAPALALSSYPGEPCNITADCAYGVCTSGVCFGSNSEEACTSHSQCNPGLRCSSSKCSALLSEGATGCSTDSDCIPTCGCNKQSGVYTCVPYFSLSSGSAISLCNNTGQGRYSFLCSSGVCLNSFKSVAGVCSDAPVSANPNPYNCVQDSDCQGFTSVFNYTGVCTCGINPYASSYCQPFIGDVPGLAYLQALKDFISQGYTMQCNTVRRFTQQCWDLFSGNQAYKSLKTAKFYYENYPKLINNDICIESTIFPDYYEIKSSSRLLLLSVIWFII